MDKIEHQRKKLRYYRDKYYGEYVEKYEENYREEEEKKNRFRR